MATEVVLSLTYMISLFICELNNYKSAKANTEFIFKQYVFTRCHSFPRIRLDKTQS